MRGYCSSTVFSTAFLSTALISREVEDCNEAHHSHLIPIIGATSKKGEP
jgi:hypothetical protein